MKRLIVLCLVTLGAALFFSVSDAKTQGINHFKPSKIDTAGAVQNRLTPFGNVPLYFVPNKGQVNEKAAFYAKTPGYTLWMTKEGLVFDSVKKIEEKVLKRDVSRFVFINANKNPGMAPKEMTPQMVNYLKGNNPSKWKTGIRTSKAVLYTDIYKNIDLKVYGIEKKIEYDWKVKPGGNPAEICFRYENVKGTHIDAEGNLLIETGFGELTHKQPVAYQGNDAERVTVDARFRKIAENTYGFEVGEYDKSRELIIDPVVVVYSTYLGGSGDEHAFGLAVSDHGRAFLTGDTYSTDFPIDDAYQGSMGGGNRDAFVSRYTSSGNLVYSTFLGGSGDDTGGAIQVDASGKIYLVGFTYSTDFPTKNPYQAANNGDSDIFVCILSSSGMVLEYSTYFGGSNGDEGLAMALDVDKNIYITGRTYSSDFPTLNAYQGTFKGGDIDAFAVKFSVSGAGLVYSTYLGGKGKDTGYGVAVNGSNAYVAGRTGSTNFPTHNEIQSTYGGGTYDGFVTKLSSTGGTLVYSTYLGGGGTDSAYGIAVDAAGSAYVTGDTSGSGFPTQNAYQGTYGGGTKDAFVSKFDTTGTSLVYSTYIGGIENDQAAYIAVDGSGNACIAGSTQSSNFPVKRAFQNAYSGGFDTFVTMFSTDGSSLTFSTYLGGSEYDSGRAAGFDMDGNIYMAGYTESSDFPTQNAEQSSMNGDMDAFVVKFSLSEFGTLCGGVDNCGLTWTTGGDADWFEQTNTVYYDGDALQSGAIGDSQSSYIQTTVTGPGLLGFWWNVSSATKDQLKFYIDDVLQSSISITSYWRQETYTVPVGTHTLRWSYEKNSFDSYGSDCGWLDKVEFTLLPTIVLNRDRLIFGASGGNVTGAQTFSVTNGNSESTLNWTAAADHSWMVCSPTSGTNTGFVTVSVDAAGLSAGTHTGTITVSDPYAGNSPQTVPVTLVVYGPGGSSGPFGNYATPENNSTISSSVPFTGWVLDDIGVQSVKLYRQANGGSVYIGDALLVEGARPDVEQAYPGYPFNYKAGWGYMMLTHFLPDGGNGTFTILAVATDMEGNQTTLGSKTVTVDNANAVKPFGAIDTPTQGGGASGTVYRNQGWVLTPRPNAIPTDGSTIEVFVDGVKLGHAFYNFYRSDIAALFPGYANSDGAHAYFEFDTTKYDDGVHTIMWVAADDAGNADGIGSRYFMVQNAGGARAARKTGGSELISEIPVDYSGAVGVMKGFEKDGEPGDLYPDDGGMLRCEVRELERVVFHFGEGKGLSGFMMVGDRPGPLPLGSTLEVKKGIFYWQLGPGYVGEYRLVFIEIDENGNSIRKNIVVNVVSKH